MPTTTHYDLLSIGSGEAGKYIAWNYASQHNKKCAVIERKWIGGSCPNIACLPSKNLVHSANVAHYARLAGQYGIKLVDAGAEVDMRKVKEKKNEMVSGLVDMHLGKFEGTCVELIQGTGRFIGPKRVQIDDERIVTADKVIICTGSRARIDESIPGLLEARPLTHIELLDLDVLPKHLIILGAGYVGLEFAQAFKRLGAAVTVVDRHDRPLKDEDPDVVEVLVEILKTDGVEFMLSTSVSRVEGMSGSRVDIHLAGGLTISGSHLLVATGRTPNTEHLGADAASVELSTAGHIVVNEQLRTTSEGTWAVGDVANSPHFTHVGFDDFRVVMADLIGTPRLNGTTGRQVPSTLFTSPELAHVGLREEEAKVRGVKYRLAKLPMAAFLRTRTLDETAGFAKALIEENGSRILGFTALGPNAGEMLPVVQLAMKLGVSYEEIAGLVITHPTMCEGLVSLFSSVPTAT